jgi:hypothetical protein
VATTAANPTIAPTIEPISEPTFNTFAEDGCIDGGVCVGVGADEDREVEVLEGLVVVSVLRCVELVAVEDVVNDKSCSFHRIWIGQAICHHV